MPLAILVFLYLWLLLSLYLYPTPMLDRSHCHTLVSRRKFVLEELILGKRLTDSNVYDVYVADSSARGHR